MSDPSPTLWQNFIAELSQVAGFDQNHFKIASGLVAADWEVLDTTGLPPHKPNQGQPVPSQIFNWADPMPEWSPATYMPGNSFSDMYGAFLGALKPSPPVTNAIARAKGSRMPDPQTGPFPSYTVSPSLSQWYTAALQALATGAKPQLDFTITPPQFNLAELKAAPGSHNTPPGDARVASPFLQINPPVAPLRGAEAAVAAAQPPGGSVPSQDMSIHYQAQNVGKFFVQPGRWFDSSMLAIYSDQIRANSPLAHKDLFGAKGLLNLSTRALVVAYRRSITLTGPTAQVAAFKSALEGGQGVAAGGFAFHPKAADVHQGDATTITIKDNTNVPHVIGVGIQIMG